MSTWQITYYNRKAQPCSWKVADSLDELEEEISHLVEILLKNHSSFMVDFHEQRILGYKKEGIVLNPIISWKYVNS